MQDEKKSETKDEELTKETETVPAETPCGAPEPEPKPEPEKAPEPSELERARAELAEQKACYLRLAAEYDNFRKRTQKEKDHIYSDAKADTTEKFLGIYDNLARAVAQETGDEAYKKGVVMIMSSYMDILSKLGVELFGEPGERFDPELHNAVMHVQDEALGESVITDVFQKGFRVGEKVVRTAMVKVAN